ncbi:MAG: CvpA family protein [Planctomycetota bacterium]|nr:CvpA family protein [Planctomycetota bacterium]
MLELTFLLIFLAVGAGCWFAGLWNNLITLVSLIFAGMIATTLFEPLADQLEPQVGLKYQIDFICLWGIFFVSFGVLRLITELLSSFRVKFNNIVETVGRSLLSFWIAWCFLCFSLFSLHVAPIEPAGFGGFQRTPTQNNFMGIGPDRMWLAFVQSRSFGAFAEYKDVGMLPEYKERLHPDDQNTQSRIFDSTSEFILKYRYRRQMLSESGSADSESTDGSDEN